MKRVVVLVALTLIAAAALAQQPMTLALDASDVARGLLHAKMNIPLPAGPATLVYPQWIPGEHGPTGPIANLVNVQVTANGQRVAWRRDPVNMFAFHLDVPTGASSVDVSLDFILPNGGQFSGGRTATSSLAVISWNNAVLSPSGRSADDIQVKPSLRIPNGWKFATALPVESVSGNDITFKPAPLATVIDSPVQMGSHQKVVALKVADERPHEIDLVADGDAALELPENFTTTYNNLVDQAGLLFGGRHYRWYHWLLTLSDNVAHFGLEHHESSDDRVNEDALQKPAGQRGVAELLSHEYVHSWNGKYRRPAGLLSPDYQKPMEGELLWVYEGLTQYCGSILPPRIGAWTPEYYRDYLASVASDLESESGRTWRPLADTAVEAQVLYNAGGDWWSLRRGVDFYDESILVWLDADTLIREQSGGKKALDDFTRRFYGGLTGPMVKPYTFDDVVTAMNETHAYDWRAFFNARLNSVDPHAPMAGITRGGWKLVYTDKENEAMADGAERSKGMNLRTTLGVQLGQNGAVNDVTPGLPAAKAGIAPGFRIIAVNGRKFTNDVLHAVLKASTTSKDPIELIVQNGDNYSVVRVDYHGGLQYPHLVRDETKKDLLTPIITKR
jgi:predicted metalloprotease with PDZ domain